MGTGGRDERSKRFHPRLRLALLGIGLLVAAGLAGATEPARALDPTIINRLMGGSDWYHALDVIASVNETSPDVPVVLLLGGSCAREATVSDGDWAAQVERRGVPAVLTYNMGSRNQTFYEDVAFVKGLPQVPCLLYTSDAADEEDSVDLGGR